MEWRQINFPIPILNEQSLRLLKKGAIYCHGRAKDLSPILHINVNKIGQMMDAGDMSHEAFINLHNFVTGYINQNMFVPGQVDRWLTIGDLAQFSIMRVPVNIFRSANRELSNNFLENSQKTFCLNMTWFSSAMINTFTMFLDAEIRSK